VEEGLLQWRSRLWLFASTTHITAAALAAEFRNIAAFIT
jgi:hypothetical protein